MFGIFIVPAKSDNKDFKYHKDGKKALALDDESFVQLIRHTQRMSYFVHWKNDFDECSDIEKIESLKKYYDRDYTKCKKLRSPQSCYMTENGEYYIRIVMQDRSWFNRNYGN